jgi:iron-sulfur cluster repair protein YtfE (RIC family)
MEAMQIDASMTVNAVIARYPAALTVFHAHGVDACCGGALPLAVVAERHRLDLDALVAEVVAVAGRAP